MARPTPANPEGKQIAYKRTPEIKKKLEEAFALDATQEEACAYAGVSRPFLNRWWKDDPELRIRMEALRNNPTLLARQSVIRAMKNDGKLALKYLERKRKKEFSPQVDIHASGEIQVNVVDFHKEPIDVELADVKDIEPLELPEIYEKIEKIEEIKKK